MNPNDINNVTNEFNISSDVLNVDGEHNGENYVAHTFYVKTKRVIPLITEIFNICNRSVTEKSLDFSKDLG